MERIRDIARLAIGVVAGDDAGSVTWSMRRWDGPPEPRARATAGHALEVLDTESGELHAQSVFDGFDRGALRLRWPIADRSGRDLVYVTVGLAEQTTGQPRLRLWQHFTRHLHGSARAPGRGM